MRTKTRLRKNNPSWKTHVEKSSHSSSSGALHYLDQVIKRSEEINDQRALLAYKSKDNDYDFRLLEHEF